MKNKLKELALEYRQGLIRCNVPSQHANVLYSAISDFIGTNNLFEGGEH